jgi:hypothetical protein
MSIIENLTLKQLSEETVMLPKLAHFASRALVDTYDEFIKILHQDIDEIIQDIQENPELKQNDSEDRLTLDTLVNLRRLGYEASHDSKVGGHTDLLVKHSRGYKWIGEAKIYDGNAYLWKGFMQLTERYSIGDHNQKDGGMLIYLKIPNADRVIQSWKEYLESQNLPEYKYETCSTNNLYFFSKHRHTKSGLIFTVRHMTVLLHFNPQDSTKKSKSQSSSKSKSNKKETE